ncbi:hypothetical protein JHD50_01585 [Sulfurimonas sp. MAG313]|nr:hypothetical protein [Sulfurimonas sp. MAG313]MDF1880001.1 hypothetical protein [Sulfurimonas sp. MAG313]
MKLKFENIYADKLSLHTIESKTEEEVEKIFLNRVYNKIHSLKLKGFDTYVENMSFSGFFSGKTQVLTVEFKKSKLKKASACFFIEVNGAAYIFRLYKGMDKKYFEGLTEKPLSQRLEFIKNRMGDFEERNNFSSFDALMDMLFIEAVKNLPE